MATVFLNGAAREAKTGERLIDLILRLEIELPAVCYHPQLGPLETCDTCMVELDGRLVRACANAASEGMRVVTNTAAASAAQREAFDRILSNHMLYCTVCDNNNGNCTIHNTTKLLAVEHQAIPFKPKPYEVDDSNPFYRYDPSQCLLCGRCVEACQDVEVNETLSINWEDENPRVLWDGGSKIGESSCVSCGHCVTVCPCNALMEKSMLGRAGFLSGIPKPALEGMIEIVKGIEPEAGYGTILKVSEAESAMRSSRVRRTKTVCTYCGVGCSFDVWTKDRHILKVEPEHGPTNGISTCIKGKFGWDFVNSSDRLGTPLIREGDKFREASWDEAIGLVARRMLEIKAKDGPDSLAFISSSKCTNEESYLMQKLARAVVGTNNIDNCSRYCQAPATQGLFRTVGYGGDSGSITDIASAGLVMIIGSNTAESHPVLATRVKSAHKLRGQKLIVADLREHEMASRADVFLRPTSGHGSDLSFGDQPLHPRCRLGQERLPRPVGRGSGRLPQESRAVHPGSGGERMRAFRYNLEGRRAYDCRSRRRVHPLGDGGDAAYDGLGRLDGHFQPAFDHRELHAARGGRVSIARTQQRSGRKRPGRDAEPSTRLSGRRRP